MISDTERRDVIETMTKARDMLLELIEQRDKAEARFQSLLDIGPVVTERKRCITLLQVYGVLQNMPLLDIIEKIRNGEQVPS